MTTSFPNDDDHDGDSDVILGGAEDDILTTSFHNDDDDGDGISRGAGDDSSEMQVDTGLDRSVYEAAQLSEILSPLDVPVGNVRYDGCLFVDRQNHIYYRAYRTRVNRFPETWGLELQATCTGGLKSACNAKVWVQKNSRGKYRVSSTSTEAHNHPPRDDIKAIGTHPCILGCNLCDNIKRPLKVEIPSFAPAPTKRWDCKSQNLIYLISCDCEKQYVGETSGRLRDRMQNHFGHRENLNASLGYHWKECEEMRIKNFSTRVLGEEPDGPKRRTKELTWMVLLGTVGRNGLNDQGEISRMRTINLDPRNREAALSKLVNFDDSISSELVKTYGKLYAKYS